MKYIKSNQEVIMIEVFAWTFIAGMIYLLVKSITG
jgi:hypothetical protein